MFVIVVTGATRVFGPFARQNGAKAVLEERGFKKNKEGLWMSPDTDMEGAFVCPLENPQGLPRPTHG